MEEKFEITIKTEENFALTCHDENDNEQGTIDEDTTIDGLDLNL